MSHFPVGYNLLSNPASVTGWANTIPFFQAAIRTLISNRQLLELSGTYNSITTDWSRSCLTKMTVFRSIRIVILAMLLCKRTNRIHESASLITYCSDERDSSKTQMKAEVNFPHFFVKKPNKLLIYPYKKHGWSRRATRSRWVILAAGEQPEWRLGWQYLTEMDSNRIQRTSGC